LTPYWQGLQPLTLTSAAPPQVIAWFSTDTIKHQHHLAIERINAITAHPSATGTIAISRATIK
jgi:hypothetical protein